VPAPRLRTYREAKQIYTTSKDAGSYADNLKTAFPNCAMPGFVDLSASLLCMSRPSTAAWEMEELIVHRPEPTSDHGTTLALWHNVVRRGEANAGMPPVLRPSSCFKLVRWGSRWSRGGRRMPPPFLSGTRWEDLW